MISHKVTHQAEYKTSNASSLESNCSSMSFINLGSNTVNIVLSAGGNIALNENDSINFEADPGNEIQDTYTIVFAPSIILTNNLMIIRQFISKL
jgi:hypothetical protein